MMTKGRPDNNERASKVLVQATRPEAPKEKHCERYDRGNVSSTPSTCFFLSVESACLIGFGALMIKDGNAIWVGTLEAKRRVPHLFSAIETRNAQQLDLIGCDVQDVAHDWSIWQT